MNQAPAESLKPQPPAERPAIFATFYVRREKKEVIGTLQNLLCRGLDLKEERPGVWSTSDKNQSAELRRFDLSATPEDTTFLQLILNSQGDVAKAWEDSRRRLENSLRPGALKDIWGYTLHHQANLNPGHNPQETFEKLRPAARLLGSGEASKGPYASIAQAEMAQGWMWLLTVPASPTEEGDGSSVGTVYVALTKSEQERGFSGVVLGEKALGKRDNLLVPDLIAHKSYFQKRQYLGKEGEEYKGLLEGFRKLIVKLLENPESREVQAAEVTTDELTDLSHRYHDLAKRIWDREGLRVSMAQQLHNYDEWEITENNDIFRYHRRHIETAGVELELLVSEGRYALGVADPVLSINRYKLEKKEERKRWWTQTLVTVAAAILALSQLIDKEVTGALIGRFSKLESYEVGTLTEFFVQIGLIAIVLVILYLIWLFLRRLGVYSWFNKRRSSQSQEGK